VSKKPKLTPQHPSIEDKSFENRTGASFEQSEKVLFRARVEAYCESAAPEEIRFPIRWNKT
jgi:hypothetical protein